MKLYGSYTSPYVRRVRVVAAELGVELELVDTKAPGGDELLRAFSPIWKVPVADLDGAPVFDSHLITERLVALHPGRGVAALADDDLDGRNAVSVIDGALDALINVFYLGLDGLTPAQSSYIDKQRKRAEACLGWIEARLAQGPLTPGGTLGLPEVALGTSLAWMRFREAYDLTRHPALVETLERLEARPSFAATRPPGA